MRFVPSWIGHGPINNMFPTQTSQTIIQVVMIELEHECLGRAPLKSYHQPS